MLVLRSVEGLSFVLRLDLGDDLGVTLALPPVPPVPPVPGPPVLLRLQMSNVGVATARNRSVEGDGERMDEVVRLVAWRDLRGDVEFELESIEIPLDSDDAGDIAVAILSGDW